MVSALEEQYDDQSGRREIGSQQVTLPSADDIGAEAEAFLRSMDDPGDDGGTPVQGPTTTPDQPVGDSGDDDPRAEKENPQGRRSEDDGDGPDGDEDDGGPTDLYRPRHGDDSWGLS